MALYSFQKYVYDSTESPNVQTTIQVGTQDIVLTAFYTQEIIPFDFSLAVSPSVQSVTVGNSTSFAITCALLAGQPEQVTLAVSGLPAGATASFSPATGYPPFSSTLTIQTTGNTPVGSSQLSISGFASVDHGATVTLTVNPVQVQKGTILVSAKIGMNVIANASGQITDPAGAVMASFTATPFSWDQAIVGAEYTVTCHVEGYGDQTQKATVSAEGASVSKTFLFAGEAGFPLWVAVAAGGVAVIYFVFRGGGGKKKK